MAKKYVNHITKTETNKTIGYFFGGGGINKNVMNI